ncbi:MAG: nucleotide exchange factor GrpE, partial [Candidatus Omnitrophica bacterium]|nr:nucleotide exchange factor GrpE [Candidatus Omnitrophota bacterium]
KEEASGEVMVEIKESEYQKLLKDLADYKDRYVRLCAEFENFRKRNDRERTEFVKYANEGLLTDFVGILDDLERSVEAASAKHQDYDAFLKGIEMVMAHIHDLLKKYEVKPLESVGKKFDPHRHEILMQFQSEDHEDGTVVEEFQKGYQLGDKVIRTAKVKVATHPLEETPAEKEEEI